MKKLTLSPNPPFQNRRRLHKPVDDLRHFLQFLHTLLVILFSSVGIPPSENRVLEPLPELLGGAEDPLVHEVYKGKVLEQIVLDGSPGQEDTPLTF